jgi:hypothetical protein
MNQVLKMISGQLPIFNCPFTLSLPKDILRFALPKDREFIERPPGTKAA